MNVLTVAECQTRKSTQQLKYKYATHWFCFLVPIILKALQVLHAALFTIRGSWLPCHVSELQLRDKGTNDHASDDSLTLILFHPLLRMPVSPLSCCSLIPFFDQTNLHRSFKGETTIWLVSLLRYLQKEGDAVYAGFVWQVDLDEGGC